jgi:hypothetical protein
LAERQAGVDAHGAGADRSWRWAGTAGYEYQRQWTYFQQAYLKMYIGSEAAVAQERAVYPIAYRVEGKQKRRRWTMT